MKRLYCLFLACMGSLWGNHEYPLVILGGGVGALTAATYAARSGIEPLVVEGKMPGGALMQSHSIQNWPGELDISGAEFMEKLRKQAVSNGAKIVAEEVVGVDFSKTPFTIKLASVYDKNVVRTVNANTCIIAMGSEPNRLGVPGENTYWASGVHTCAVCDGALYKDKVVAVVGGGDAAVTEAHYLAKKAKKVFVIVRKGEFRGKEIKRRQELIQLDNVEVLYHTVVHKVLGGEFALDRLFVEDVLSKKTYELPVDGLFLAIGATPNSQLFQSVLDVDDKGYIVLHKDQETSKKGVFAIGDIVDPKYKQALGASRDGAIAALQAEMMLTQKKQKEKEGVEEITSFADFQMALKNSTGPIFVDVYATWCGPCHMVFPIFESASQRLSGKVRFLKVNAEVVEEVAAKYHVQQLPSLLVFDKNGGLIEKKIGVQPIAQFLQNYK